MVCFHPMSPFNSLQITFLIFLFLLYFSSLLITPFHHNLFLLNFFSIFTLLLLIITLLSAHSASLLFLSLLVSHSFVSTFPSFTFCLPLTYHSLPPSYLIIRSLYWCSCRNETRLWLICWQSLRGPLVVVPLHRGNMWLIEPGENVVRLAIMTGSLACS